MQLTDNCSMFKCLLFISVASVNIGVIVGSVVGVLIALALVVTIVIVVAVVVKLNQRTESE